MVRFSASQSVSISVPPQPRPIEAYLSEPARLVYALVDKQQVETLSPTMFRMRMRAIRFFSISVQPICDIEVWLEGDTVRLRSDHCEVEGYKLLNESFTLNLQGYLVVQSTPKGKKLRGQANLMVSVDLPPALKFTPKKLVERTGSSLLNGILITMKQRLMRQLINDYSDWAILQGRGSANAPSEVSSLT